ncbi:hypothetical protein LJB87_02930 [Alistipes sp. OttesenSCG-928-L06]|nr:hypothetical protein [Alistipes sp. OttesenSCG-928-L06]
MKKFITPLITILLFTSCGSGGSSNSDEKKVAELETAIVSAEASAVVETEIFLGFKFGMSDKQLREHLDQLVNEGRVYIDEKGNYAYDFSTGQNVIKFTFVPKYHDNKLYRLNFIMDNHGNSIGTPSLNTVLAAKTFMETDRSGFRSFITEDILGDAVYTHVKNNLIICFDTPSKGGRMSYINAPVEKVVREQAQAQKNDNKNRTLSDF